MLTTPSIPFVDSSSSALDRKQANTAAIIAGTGYITCVVNLLGSVSGTVALVTLIAILLAVFKVKKMKEKHLQEKRAVESELELVKTVNTWDSSAK